MLKATSTAAIIVLLALTTPALGDLYTFEIDEEQSTVAIGGAVETAMDGTFALDLAGSPGDWSGKVVLDTVTAVSLKDVNLGAYLISAGDLRLTDFDTVEDDPGFLLGAPIAEGTVNAEVYVYADVQGVATLQGWEGPFAWNVEVADDNHIGSKEPGWTPEARLIASGMIEDELLGPLEFEVTLVGARVPEPSTITLVLIGMAVISPLVWRRRRRGT